MLALFSRFGKNLVFGLLPQRFFILSSTLICLFALLGNAENVDQKLEQIRENNARLQQNYTAIYRSKMAGNSQEGDYSRLKYLSSETILQLTKKVKLVFGIGFYDGIQDLDDNDQINNKELSNILETAKVVIKDVGGVPMAVIIGKQYLSYGQLFSRMNVSFNDPLASLSYQGSAYGLSIVLDDKFFEYLSQLEHTLLSNAGHFLEKHIDGIEFSIFENGTGRSFSISDNLGAALRIHKDLSPELKAQFSLYSAETDGPKRDQRINVGLVYESGKIALWCNFLLLEGNLFYPDSSFGVTVGAGYDIHPKINLAIEATHLNGSGAGGDARNQIGLSLKTNPVENFWIGPEIRYGNIYGRNSWDASINISKNFSSPQELGEIVSRLIRPKLWFKDSPEKKKPYQSEEVPFTKTSFIALSIDGVPFYGQTVLQYGQYYFGVTYTDALENLDQFNRISADFAMTQLSEISPESFEEFQERAGEIESSFKGDYHKLRRIQNIFRAKLEVIRENHGEQVADNFLAQRAQIKAAIKDVLVKEETAKAYAELQKELFEEYNVQIKDLKPLFKRIR